MSNAGFSSWPQIAVITPGRARRSEELVPRAVQLFELGMQMLVLREPQLPLEEQAVLTDALAVQCPELFVVHHLKCPGTRRLMKQKRVAVHLPSHAMQAWCEDSGPFGVSVHGAQELQHARTRGASYAMLAPIWSPNSKPQDRRIPLGPQAFEAAQKDCEIPLFALGGVSAANCHVWRGRRDLHVALIGQLFAPDWKKAREDFSALKSLLSGV